MADQRFQDQTAIVTGGASGIGLAIGTRLAREGANVTLWDVNETLLARVTQSLRDEGFKVNAAAVDITNEKAVRDAVRPYNQLDIMVNSAGIVGPTSTNITDFDLTAFERVLRVNLVGSFIVTKYAVEKMQPRQYGRILLMASIAGKEGNPGMAGYAASKGGVISLVKGIGKEVAELGITVNGLAPAVIATPMNADTAPEQLKYMSDKIPMKRLGTVEETAALACWIVSKEASFNTATIFDLSGGRATY